MIDNPAYKVLLGSLTSQLQNSMTYFQGKWFAPMIANPGYQGKWKPALIPNPDFFEDKEPFKMTPVRFLFHSYLDENMKTHLGTFSGVGLELWSMSDNIYFDNFLITDNMALADAFARETFDLKQAADASANGNMFRYKFKMHVSMK